MTRTALLALQGAIFNQLNNDGALMSKITGVFDEVPDGQAMPYVALGEDEWSPYLTFDRSGEDISHTLHVWSDYNGKMEVKQIMGLVLQAMTTKPMTLSTQMGTMFMGDQDAIIDDPFLVDGFHVANAQLEFMQVMDDANGDYRHGVMRFNFKIQD